MRNFAEKQQNLLQVEENMSNLTSASNEASVSSSNRTDINGGGGGGGGGFSPAQYHFPPPSQPPPAKKKRNQPGHPDPDAEVIALSPRALLATNRFVCEICGKGFQRDQNLQLHRRGHNLPWKLKQRASKDAARKKVYVCPEVGCVHHDPARALGDLTGIKKHYCRKHGEKKWKCDKCSKKYAVQSDWKAHSKTCGTKEYRCDCGTLFSRRDSFITHRAFCDALAEESARSIAHPKSTAAAAINPSYNPQQVPSPFFNIVDPTHLHNPFLPSIKKEPQSFAGMIRPGPDFPPWVSSFHLPAILGSATDPSAASSNIFQGFSAQNTNPNAHPGAAAAAAAAGLHLPPYPQPPSPPPPPQISATALLQKAEQMGSKRSGGDTPPCVFGGPARQFPWATHALPGGETMPATAGFGLNLSSRDGLVGSLVGSSFADKAAGAGAVAGAGGVGTHNSLFQNVIMDNPEAFHNHQGPSDFDEMAFMFSGRAFSRKDDGQDEENLDFQAAMDEFNRSGDGGGCSDIGKARVTDGMTRDFLGLRAWPQSDILTLTGLSSCMDSNGGGHNEP